MRVSQEMLQLPQDPVAFFDANNDRPAPLNETTNSVLPFSIVRIEARCAQRCCVFRWHAERHHRTDGACGIQ